MKIALLFLSILAGCMSANASNTSISPLTFDDEIELSWPVKGIITQGYRGEEHDAIDIAGITGREIMAAYDGVVVVRERNRRFGYYIMIDHENGFVTGYAHNSKLIAKKGQRVKKGEVISLMGSTGYSSGPHLHFEVIKNDKHVNPQRFLPPMHGTKKKD